MNSPKLIALILSAVGLLCCSVLAQAEDAEADPTEAIMGKWISYFYRTVIGTGGIDATIEIAGRPDRLSVVYSTSGRERIRIRESDRFFFKTTRVTYENIWLNERDGLYFFTVPEQGNTIFFKPGTVDDKPSLIITDENGKEAKWSGTPYHRVPTKHAMP